MSSPIQIGQFVTGRDGRLQAARPAIGRGMCCSKKTAGRFRRPSKRPVSDCATRGRDFVDQEKPLARSYALHHEPSTTRRGTADIIEREVGDHDRRSEARAWAANSAHRSIARAGRARIFPGCDRDVRFSVTIESIRRGAGRAEGAPRLHRDLALERNEGPRMADLGAETFPDPVRIVTVGGMNAGPCRH